MSRNVLKWVLATAIALSLLLVGLVISRQNNTAVTPAATQEDAVIEASPAAVEDPVSIENPYYNPGDSYQLEQVVVLSRHNIRSPLSGTGSALDLATPHDWFAWTSNPSELSLRGGALETTVGQYFRLWLESENLIPENWRPTTDEARFYANSMQRTIATAQYFSSGMLPVANVRIETHVDYNTMDPVFTPQITFLSSSYEEAALAEIGSTYGSAGMSDVAAGLAEPYALLAEVLDYEESEGYKSGQLGDLVTNDTQVTLAVGNEPSMSGSLKLASTLTDALILQYYEEPDPLVATFGHELTDEQWLQIDQIKETCNELVVCSPLVAPNLAHPLLQEIAGELDTDGRVFSFLCGHDTNIASVVASLGVESYELPSAIEIHTPIGAKLLFERWSDADGNQYGRLRLVYCSVDQLRNLALLTAENPPLSYDLTLTGLEKNADGLYTYADLRGRIDKAIADYDALQEAYPEEEELPAAA